jgi:hypothetical protein
MSCTFSSGCIQTCSATVGSAEPVSARAARGQRQAENQAGGPWHADRLMQVDQRAFRAVERRGHAAGAAAAQESIQRRALDPDQGSDRIGGVAFDELIQRARGQVQRVGDAGKTHGWVPRLKRAARRAGHCTCRPRRVGHDSSVTQPCDASWTFLMYFQSVPRVTL